MMYYDSVRLPVICKGARNDGETDRCTPAGNFGPADGLCLSVRPEIPGPSPPQKLAGLVRSLEACAVPCAEWNDALIYLGGGESCSTAEKARAALLELLDSSA